MNPDSRRMIEGIFRGRNQFGASLLEALVTLLVISLGLLALARLQAGLWRSQSTVMAAAEAVRLGQEKMDALRTHVDTGADRDQDDARLANITYHIDWATMTSDRALLRRHQVTVGWDDPASTDRIRFAAASLAPEPPSRRQWLSRILVAMPPL